MFQGSKSQFLTACVIPALYSHLVSSDVNRGHRHVLLYRNLHMGLGIINNGILACSLPCSVPFPLQTIVL